MLLSENCLEGRSGTRSARRWKIGRWVRHDGACGNSVRRFLGARGRGRTDMVVRPHDFESCASANSATRARKLMIRQAPRPSRPRFALRSAVPLRLTVRLPVEHVCCQVSSGLSGTDALNRHGCDCASPQIVNRDIPAPAIGDAFRHLGPRAAIVSHCYILSSRLIGTQRSVLFFVVNAGSVKTGSFRSKKSRSTVRYVGIRT